MKKKISNVLFVGLLICSTYVLSFANGLSLAKNDCDGNGTWDQWTNHPGCYMCYDGGTACNAGQTKCD